MDPWGPCTEARKGRALPPPTHLDKQRRRERVRGQLQRGGTGAGIFEMLWRQPLPGLAWEGGVHGGRRGNEAVGRQLCEAEGMAPTEGREDSADTGWAKVDGTMG